MLMLVVRISLCCELAGGAIHIFHGMPFKFSGTDFDRALI